MINQSEIYATTSNDTHGDYCGILVHRVYLDTDTSFDRDAMERISAQLTQFCDSHRLGGYIVNLREGMTFNHLVYIELKKVMDHVFDASFVGLHKELIKTTGHFIVSHLDGELILDEETFIEL